MGAKPSTDVSFRAKPGIPSAALIHSMLDRAALLYLPGGNTYLAAKRLHAAGLVDDLRERILGGLPLVAFSAGTVLCGVDILTSNDPNDCGCSDFAGFELLPVNFNVHYPPAEGEERQERAARLRAYALEQHRSVLALEDGAYILVEGGSVKAIRGLVYRFDRHYKDDYHDKL